MVADTQTIIAYGIYIKNVLLQMDPNHFQHLHGNAAGIVKQFIKIIVIKALAALWFYKKLLQKVPAIFPIPHGQVICMQKTVGQNRSQSTG